MKTHPQSITAARRFALLAIVVLAAALPAGAAEQVLTLDPGASQVTFLLDATGHDVEGKLYLQSGEIRFDPESGQASGEVTLDARRTETGNAKRDKKMHSEVLESAEHPLITFTAKRVEGKVAESGASEITLHGTVRLLGQEHPLAMPTKVEVQDGGQLAARTTFSVPYVQWGLEDPSIAFLRVAKEVEVTIAADGRLSAP